jgi:cardiolipin synthase
VTRAAGPGAAQGFRLRAAHIPNLICVLRILLVPPVAVTLLSARYREALALIVVAGLSDGLDGFLAKRYRWQSRLGGILDPIADKLLLTVTFVALAFQSLVPVWLAALVILRDVVIVSGGVAYQWLVAPVEPEPSRVSKLNTGMQLLFLCLVVTAAAFPGVVPVALIDTSVLVAGAGVLVTGIVSGLDYVLRWSARARQHGQ